MNKKFDKITKILRIVFPYLGSVTFFLTLVETYTYKGFVSKFLILDTNFFILLTISSGLLSFPAKTRLRRKKNNLSALFLSLNALVLPILIVTYWIMTVMETIKYHNYVFSTYHLQPENFLYTIILSVFLFILFIFSESSKYKEFDIKTTAKRLNAEYKTKEIVASIFVILGLSLFVLDNVPKTLDSIVNYQSFIFSNLNASYAEKMYARWGFYSDYMFFVDEYVKEDNAVIASPPQETPWLNVGNASLDRYFVYPKYIVRSNLSSLPSDVDVDYVLIAKGLWPAEKEKYGWPKFSVSAEKIWYIDSETKEISEFSEDYDKNHIDGSYGSWGLIKIKK